MDVTHYRADCSITDWNLLPVDMAAVLPIILVMASVTPRCRARMYGVALCVGRCSYC